MRFILLFENPISIDKYVIKFVIYCRGTIEMGLRHIMLEKKNQHEAHARRTREKDRDLKTLKKAELQVKVAEENLLHTRSVNEKTKSQVHRKLLITILLD